VLNGDDPFLMDLAASAPGPVLTYSMLRAADVTAEVIERNAAEQSLLINIREQTAVVRTRMLGDQHVQNCLVAAAVGLAAGMDLATIARGIERVERLPGRLERVDRCHGLRVFLDSASTPTALAAALDAIRPTAERRLWCVADVPQSGDEDDLTRFGSALARLADVAVVTPDEEDLARAARLRHMIAGMAPAEHVTISRNRAQAIDAAIRSAEPDDVVLIVGTSGKLSLDRVAARQAVEGTSREKQYRPAFSS
jgi:UDP-N-acetylmuramoyl-L-alanyl-D-glutamate--2,6-diaminopimelate ligase